MAEVFGGQLSHWLAGVDDALAGPDPGGRRHSAATARSAHTAT